MKKSFIVTVCRISHSFADLTIEADSEEAANETALEEAGNHSYSEKSADYEVSGTLAQAHRPVGP